MCMLCFTDTASKNLHWNVLYVYQRLWTIQFRVCTPHNCPHIFRLLLDSLLCTCRESAILPITWIAFGQNPNYIERNEQRLNYMFLD